METPVYDFVQEYIQKKGARLHMPGHKGQVFLGCEPLDITEIAGADVLSESEGILGLSQKNASELFGTGATFYSTEGSSQCIKAMLAVTLMAWQSQKKDGRRQTENTTCPKKRPWVLAARNIHRAMIDACALLDLDLEFIPFSRTKSICSVNVEAESVESVLSSCKESPVGVYLTSPDYLGMQLDIAAIASICHLHQVPLLVDNAHGAYLAFLEENQHPMALGADICCDSAHKTLPVLTGGAYLHFAHSCAARFAPYASKALTLFGSTSPSYLILQSLDLCNQYLADGYDKRLGKCVRKTGQIKDELTKRGIIVQSGEPLKIVIHTAASGYRGLEIAQELRDFRFGEAVHGIECEYADEQFLVLMMTPENRKEDFASLLEWTKVTRLNKKKEPLLLNMDLTGGIGKRRMSIREAILSDSETIPVHEAAGRILAQETVSCPPAVPIGISGEEVTAEMVELFRMYGILEIAVVACKV